VKWPWRKQKPPATLAEAMERDVRRMSRGRLVDAVLGTSREMAKWTDLMTATTTLTSDTTSESNPYESRSDRIAEIAAKYEGTAEWGCFFIKKIINYRRARLLPDGFVIAAGKPYVGTGRAEADPVRAEREFVESVIAANGLADGQDLDWAKEAEIEGQLLVRLAWDPALKGVVLRPMYWRETAYDIEPADANNPAGPRLAYIKDEQNEIIETLEDDAFEFVFFNGSGGALQGSPVAGDVLVPAESLHKALYDWRALDRLFAHPTPFFETDDKATADALQTLLAGSEDGKWKLGAALAAKAKFGLVGPTDQSAQWLAKEMVANIQIISGLSGVPIYELGHPEVMSNRSTAETMGDTTEAEDAADRKRWTRFLTNVVRKSLRLRNAALHGQLREDAVVVEQGSSSDRQWQRVQDVFLPGASAGIYSRRTVHEQTPGIDADEEADRLAQDGDANTRQRLAAFGAEARTAIGE